MKGRTMVGLGEGLRPIYWLGLTAECQDDWRKCLTTKKFPLCWEAEGVLCTFPLDCRVTQQPFPGKRNTLRHTCTHFGSQRLPWWPSTEQISPSLAMFFFLFFRETTAHIRLESSGHLEQLTLKCSISVSARVTLWAPGPTDMKAPEYVFFMSQKHPKRPEFENTDRVFILGVILLVCLYNLWLGFSFFFVADFRITWLFYFHMTCCQLESVWKRWRNAKGTKCKNRLTVSRNKHGLSKKAEHH